MEIRDYLKILKRRKIPIIIIAILVFGVYSFFVYKKPKYYIASSKIMVRFYTFEEKVLPGAFSAAALNLPVDAQLQIMSTRILQKDVVNRIKKKTKVKVSLAEVAQTNFYRIGTTNTIQIDAKTTDEVKSILIANTFAKSSVERNRKLSEENYIHANKYINDQLNHYRKRLAEVENDIAEFNKRHGTINFNEELLSKIDRLAQYEAQLVELNNRIEELKIMRGRLLQTLNSEDRVIYEKEIIPNPVVQEYKRVLMPLEMELLELQDRYQDKHPKVQSVKRKIDALKTKMEKDIAQFVEVPRGYPNPYYSYLTQEIIRQEMDGITSQIRKKTLEEIIKKEKEKLDNLAADQLEFVNLLREKGAVEKLYENLQNVKEQMHVTSLLKGGNAQVVEEAEAAYPTGRTTPQEIIFVLLISILAGIATGIVLEFLDDVVRTPHQVKRYLNLQVYGNIPYIEEKEERLLSQISTKSALTESYQKICFQIEKACLDINAKVLLITSAGSEEGKSTIVTNLAIALARSGERVLLVDADLRRPILHRFFNTTNTVGLTSLLSGELPIDEIDKILFNTGIDELRLLTSGPRVANPVALLKNDKMNTIIEYFRNNFGMVLFDSPPLNIVIDGTITASHLDSVILVIDATRTSRRDIKHAKQLLSNLKCKILGAILNNLTVEEGEYYYYYYYYYTRYGERMRKKGGRRKHVV